jgi:hypothetical protein
MVERKGFHGNYHIQNMKPYESGYSNPKNIAAPLGLAWSRSGFSGTVPNRSVSGQDGEFGRTGDGIHGQSQTGIELQTLATILW